MCPGWSERARWTNSLVLGEEGGKGRVGWGFKRKAVHLQSFVGLRCHFPKGMIALFKIRILGYVFLCF